MPTYEEIKQQLMAETSTSTDPTRSAVDNTSSARNSGQQSNEPAALQKGPPPASSAGDSGPAKRPVNKPIMIMLLIGTFLATMICILALLTLDLNGTTNQGKSRTEATNQETGFFEWFLGDSQVKTYRYSRLKV